MLVEHQRQLCKTFYIHNEMFVCIIETQFPILHLYLLSPICHNFYSLNFINPNYSAFNMKHISSTLEISETFAVLFGFRLYREYCSGAARISVRGENILGGRPHGRYGGWAPRGQKILKISKRFLKKTAKNGLF